MTLRKPELVLFDLDGTLVDTAPDLAWSIDATLQKLNLPICGEEKVRGWIGSGIEGVLKRALTNDINGQPDAALFNNALSIFMESYFDNIYERSRIYPGVSEALNYLQSGDFKIACVTNKGSRFTNKLLKEIGLYEKFGIVVSGDTLAVKKPDPLPLLHAASYFSIDANAALMVGDSITDINAARAAGFQILCVPYGYNMGRDIYEMKPDAVVETLADMAKLF
jgi:phosphoglycolate phosphatase